MLADHGVTTVFGLPGVHNLPLWDVADGPRIIGVRHEQAAGYAADGLARSGGGLGVAITTTGPGAMNVLASFGEAAVSHSSILVIASDVSSALRRAEPRGILHEMRDQAAPFAPLASRDADGRPMAHTGRDADDVVATLGAFLAHHRQHGEVAAYLGIPTDLLAAPCDLVPTPVAAGDGDTWPDLAPAVHAIDAMQRPALWLGGGAAAVCDRPGGADLLHAFVDRLQAPVLTTFAGRGVLAGHPLVVDAPVHEPEGHAVLAAADGLVVLGSDVDGMNSRNWRMPLPPVQVSINHALEPVRTNLPDALHIHADLGILATLTQQVAAHAPWSDPSSTADAMRARLRADPRGTNGIRLVEAIEVAWPAHAALVVDMCVAGYWLAGYARQPRPRRLAYPVGWGTLGFALPAALGSASRGIPTLAVTGDGGLMFALGELATIAQERLPITLLIHDDGGYGMLRYDQQVFGHPERGVDLTAPEWHQLAAAFGIEAVDADLDSLQGALLWGRTRNRRGQPAIVVTRMPLHPPRTTSPRWGEPMA